MTCSLPPAITLSGPARCSNCAGWCGLVLLALCGCLHKAGPEVPIVRAKIDDAEADEPVIIVSAKQIWTDAQLTLQAGDRVSISATGRIVAYAPSAFERGVVGEVGPEGTYRFSDGVIDREFPLPAAGGGPTPCYGLIGRVGGGEPFFIGKQASVVADRDGRLELGINDFDVSDNSGQFLVRVDPSAAERPVFHDQVSSAGDAGGRPGGHGSVVIFYVDGLRPDVVREMVALGHLPHIRRHFIENGTWLANAFTAFPSDTITSNGSMWTGCFSDRHGLKGQVAFNRRRLTSDSFLDPFGPQHSARHLAPQGIDDLVMKTQAAAIGAAGGNEAREEWLAARTSSVPPLYEILRRHDRNWASGVLPVMTEVPPPLWSRSLTRHMPYFQTHRAWEFMDDANADYAIKNLLARREAVTVIWLPETDTCSHKCSRGQFGVTRRTIAAADELLGTVVHELEAQGRLDQTYLILVSDHGHHGGRKEHLSNFDLGSEFFFRPRVVDETGAWVGGGLGLSVHMHRYENRHPQDNSKEFVFIDGESDGAARIYLPRRHYRSGDWTGRERPGDLLRYLVDADREPIDLPRSLASIRSVHSDGTVRQPIDLVLMKLGESSLLITTDDRGQAVIERRRGPDNRWEYAYSIVDNVQPDGAGGVSFELVASPRIDPLQLLADYSPTTLRTFHDEQTWLGMTAATRYPDSVVALARHMLWDSAIAEQAWESAPDLVVTARNGWYFGRDASPGTMHGYPLADAVRATWFACGPNVRRGARVDTPCRLVDLTPTVLDMVGIDPTESGNFDGRPVREIYRSPVEYIAHTRPVYWSEVDLGGRQRLPYIPLRASELLPRSINNPNAPLDLNNVAYDLATVGDLSVLRLLDDVISPLTRQPDTFTQVAESAESFFRRRPQLLVAEAGRVPDVTNLALADYSLTSQGNLQRVDRALDWVQVWGNEVDGLLAKPLDRESLPLAGSIHRGVDGVQFAFWELYRLGQRVVIRLVDDTVLNNVEDGTARMLNAFRDVPNEIVVGAENTSAAAR